MKKIISFSLYGNKSNFQVGAVVNVLEAKRLYPDWKCRFYTTDDEGICKQLEYLGAEIVRMDDHWLNQGHYYGSLWRFLAVDDADICIFRDADSVVNERELGAVSEWLNSDYQWHIMHDHRDHRSSKIMAGMFGYRHHDECNIPEGLAQKSVSFSDFQKKDSMLQLIKDWLNGSVNTSKSFDQKFLAAVIRPKIKNNFLSHGTYGKQFPSHYPCRYGRFVGDYSFRSGVWRGFVSGDRELFKYKTDSGNADRIARINKASLQFANDNQQGENSGLLPRVVCVYHNLGLGDHILMNGPIRHAIYNYNIKELRLICKESNYNSVAYMYRDEPKIKVMSICHKSKLKDEQKAAKWRKQHEDIRTAVTSVMLHNHGSRFPKMKKCPYCNSNGNTIPFSTTSGKDLIICPEESIHNNFYIQRDDETESDKMQKILSENRLNIGDKYAFVCVSCSLGTDPKLLNKIKASTGIPLIIAKKSVEYKGGDCATLVDYNGVMFEWMKIIEKASEIHTIDTSFFHLINSMNLKNVGKFFWKSFGRKFLDHWNKDGWELRD